jgi:hypothetical protein
MMKTLVMAGMIGGSIVGGYLPLLWGGSVLSVTSIILSAVGGFAGIWFGYKIGSRID